MFQKLRDILRVEPDESDLFLSLGTGCLFFGAYSIYPPAGVITLGVVFMALAVVQARGGA